MTQEPLRSLLIEDSVTQGKIIDKILSACNCISTPVRTASEVLNSNKLKASDFQVAFVDIQLPDGNGLDLMWPIKERWPDIVIVVMTGNAQDEYRLLEEARAKGADLVMPKPFGVEEAQALMRDVHSIRFTGQRLHHFVVIDDSLVVCKTVGQMLADAGYRVSAFNRCEEAIQRLCFDHVDVVITDLNMPGTSGKELIPLVRDLWPGVGVVAMSADESGEESADLFIKKPFSSQELLDAVQSILDEANEDIFFV